ncbi:MAG: hypothetical protein LBH43_18815, partial [Treponema sp.]|nr:hypothetical protein [Treponema sp.]
MRPPIIEYISIQRTNTRIASLEPYADLKALEITDPRGEKKDDLYRYQNGWFHVNGIVSDEETKIEVIALNIYDTREINTVLLSIPRDEGYTAYFPRWTVKEDDIIAAGVAKWGVDYKTNYYAKGERYYYRVSIEATDLSGNTSENIEEDEGYLCMWARSDEPKGILDPRIGKIILRGTPLPVDFFDDDSLEWAYTGLLTEDQWNGINEVYPGTSIPAGYNDAQKLEWLQKRLRNGDAIYNWRYDKHAKIEPIAEQINGKGLDEKLVYVPTGDQENDYGEYVLFTLAADKKLPPHDGSGPERTNQNIWSGYTFPISLVDENIPLIVFDTKNGCPEENTFPKLANGQSFEIVGYTMRENASGDNKITTFRMAWIPFEMDGGADAHISDVKKALSADNYPSSFDNTAALNGIQHWEFVESPPPGYGLFGPNTNDDVTIPGSVYYQQEFRKTFNVLGGKDDIKNVYNNFTYNGKLENETKLFVFYAMDNRGHEIFRQLRLLGMKTPPNLVVYDITNRLGNSLLPGMPDPNNSLYIDSAIGGLNQAYYAALNSYNGGAYSALHGVSGGATENDKTISYQVYPRETILKYWIKAAEYGEIAVDSISMKDISFAGESTAPTVGSGYKAADEAYSFCEYYPDVTQRTFLFEAKDKLGNTVQLQRTIAVTNAARLMNITSSEQNGTYGIGKEITLKANFSSQIYVEGGTPYLNVRYHKNGLWVYTQIPCSNTPAYANPALSLEFSFVVSEGSDERLETMFETIDTLPPSQEKRAIVLNDATKIMDYFRKDAAFIPGYANESIIMQNWTTVTNSLQEKKEITLDGKRPTILGVSAGGKTAYTDGNYYFKAGETLEFALSADKPIRASDSQVPGLQYYIRDSGGTNRGPYTTAFSYSRPNGSSALVFSLPVNATSCPYDGELVNVSLIVGIGAGTIMDNVDNEVNAAAIPVPTSRI